MNKLDSMLLQMQELSEEQMQNLSGGFVSASLAQSSLNAAGNVNVDVSGHTCACSCDGNQIVIER